MKPVARALVIRFGPIGEFVLSLPAMKRIRDAHPKAEITLLTTPQFEALAKSSGYFNHVVPEGAPGGVGGMLTLIGWMRRSRFDRVYDLQNSSATGFYFNALKPFPPDWSGTAPGCRLPHRNPARNRMHVLERQADQLKEAGVWPNAPTAPGMAPPPDLSWILKRAPVPRPVPGQSKPKPYVLLAPGASKPEKMWPVENYEALAGRLYAQGLDIVIIGGPQDSALARTVQRTVRHARDLTGNTDFAQIAVLGARAVLAIGNDAGPTHLMAAAGAPTVALFSRASDPALSAPRGYVAILQSPKLKDLSVEQVLQTAQVLARPA